MPRSVPNYLTTNANGSVGANFSGHISAAGVDLFGSTLLSPPADNQVRWLDPDTGEVLTRLVAWDTGTIVADRDDFEINVGFGGLSSKQKLELATNQTAIRIFSDVAAPFSNRWIQIVASAYSKRLLDATGASDWAWKSIYAEVQSDQGNSGGWVDMPTPGPSIVIPESGDYEYVMSANMYADTVTGGGAIGLGLNGATPPLTQRADGQLPLGESTQLCAVGKMTGLVAGDTIKMMYAGPGTYNARWRKLLIRKTS